MLGKTKNFLFNLYKKKTILFVFFFSFLELFCFVQIASASWTDDLANWIATRPLFFILKVLAGISIWLVVLAGSLLNWVLSPNFISYSYTNPGGPKANPIIETGLGVTQGFVNMLLVLILVYIAIATILRLAGYETKKLLITFIIVALLVNFAPVICGIIVDASNIVMNFFVQDLKADAFGKIMGAKVQIIAGGFAKESTWEKADDFIFQLAAMVPFLLALTFVLLIFTLIFALRYMVIWLLVILSPLAFACYILPITKKYFDKWWEQFTNWSFIGVTCGFFLYLGLLLVNKIQAGAAVPVPTTGEVGVFDSILPYFVSLIFLGVGIVFGLKTSAMGAKVVIQGAKRGGKAVGKTTATKVYGGVKAGGRAVRAEVGRIQQSYQIQRVAFGQTRTRALRSATRGYARIVPGRAGQALRPAALVRTTWAAGKGVLSAAKDVAVAGTSAAFKIKQKKGVKKCPACGNQKVAKTAKACPSCGYDFE